MLTPSFMTVEISHHVTQGDDCFDNFTGCHCQPSYRIN